MECLDCGRRSQWCPQTPVDRAVGRTVVEPRAMRFVEEWGWGDASCGEVGQIVDSLEGTSALSADTAVPCTADGEKKSASEGTKANRTGRPSPLPARSSDPSIGWGEAAPAGSLPYVFSTARRSVLHL